MPGRYLLGFLIPPVGAVLLPKFFCAVSLAFNAFFLACSFVSVFLGFLVVKFFRGVLPVFLRAVSLVLAISLKYKDCLGNTALVGLVASSSDRSFPLGHTGPLEVEGSGSSIPTSLIGDVSGVLFMLVSGVELNSEQFST